MSRKFRFIHALVWCFCLCRRPNRQKRISIRHIFKIIFILLVAYVCFTLILQPSITDEVAIIQPRTPFDHLIPSNSFDLYWTMWNTDQSTFRGRRLLVLESVFIHHPRATIIMLSSTLDDKKLFLPFRQRGYRIYAFNISLEHMLQWNWYLNDEIKYFLQHWNSSGTFFYSHLSDYLRAIALYLYGGTYMDMDALILQALPYEEFIGYDRSGAGDSCTWCVKNTSGLYLAPGFMRFRPHRKVLQHILERTFDPQVYNESCFNCVGPIAFTQYIMQYRERNDSELINLKFLESHRLYPFMWTETFAIFYDVKRDTSLRLAALMKRSYSLHLFGHMSDNFTIAQGSLIDLLFDRFDLGDLRPRIPGRGEKNNSFRLQYPSIYTYTLRKQGRFIGHDVIYLRLNQTLSNEDLRWNINIHVSNGTINLPNRRVLSNLNQAQVNVILNEMSYTPFQSTSIDTLTINITSEHVSVNCSFTILVFTNWVTVLTKTMGTLDRWPVVQRLVASVQRYFPQTEIRIASDAGERIDKYAFLNFTTADNIKGQDLSKNVFIHNMPQDSGLSICRNYLVKKTTTPFFFLLDDDFALEDDSHLDLLLELIYSHSYVDIIAGKIPEDIRDFNDYSGVYLRYNQTLELRKDVPEGQQVKALFPRLSTARLDRTNPCRRVDFVPNVFMGRKEAVLSVRWDDSFKLGEHEDFFLRFGQANRTVYTCQYIQVHHHQIPWWKRVNDPYYKKRGRVFGYYKQMLEKHVLKRIVTFGLTNMDLDKSPIS